MIIIIIIVIIVITKLHFLPHYNILYLTNFSHLTITNFPSPHHSVPHLTSPHYTEPHNLLICSQKGVPDITWSTTQATVFVCVNEGAIEVWDLSQSMFVYRINIIVVD